MATRITANFLNVVEQANRRVGGNVANIAELLAEMNEILLDAPMYEANGIYSHREVVRTKLPVISPRTINRGAKRTASQTKQVPESIMLLDVFSEPDEAVIDHEPDPKKALLNETKSFLEAAMQEFTRIMIYGNPGNDSRECVGWAVRYPAIDSNVWDIGGTGSDLTRIALVEWGEMTAKLIYPRNSQSVGIEDHDYGKIRITDEEGNPYMAYSYQVKMEFGQSNPDDRAIQQLVNIESGGGASSIEDVTNIRKLVRAKNKLPNMGKNAVLYTNRDTKSQFDIWALEKSNGFYMVENISGEPLAVFQGIPIRMAEQILSTESQVL